MEFWILVAAILTPVLVAIFGDDLRKLRRVLTAMFDFVRNVGPDLREWYARCEECESLAILVSNPKEATPVFAESLLEHKVVVRWPTQIGFGRLFSLDVTWKYRGFCIALGRHMPQGDGDLTWAVAPPPVFLSVSRSTSQHVSHWTGSALIDAATTYVDQLIEESGVADYTPPLRFRVLRWLRNLAQKPKSWYRKLAPTPPQNGEPPP